MKLRGFELVNDEFRAYPNKEIKLPVRSTEKSAGYDLFLPEGVLIGPNERVLVMSDIKAYMQSDEVLELHVRSSIGIKKGIILSNITGIIDSDYYNNPANDGNIGLALYNTTSEVVTLEAGEKVVQGIFKKYLIADNGNTDNQRFSGIGSTGK